MVCVNVTRPFKRRKEVNSHLASDRRRLLANVGAVPRGGTSSVCLLSGLLGEQLILERSKPKGEAMKPAMLFVDIVITLLLAAIVQAKVIKNTSEVVFAGCDSLSDPGNLSHFTQGRVPYAVPPSSPYG